MSFLDNRTFQAVVSAFWLAFLAVLGVNIIGGLVMPEEQTVENFGYPVEVPEVAAVATADSGAEAQRPNIIPMIALASAEDGSAGFRKCTSCHTVAADAKPMTGPSLHGVVGRTVAGDPNFAKYSESLRGIGGNWTYEKLDDYLENPKRLAPKGTMNFAGLKKAEERAAVIKFLMDNTPNAPPLPQVAEAPAEAAPAEAAPAEAAPAK
ncbi:MAG: cytochrome c family protein [Rhodospirillaceae bacterium]